MLLTIVGTTVTSLVDIPIAPTVAVLPIMVQFIISGLALLTYTALPAPAVLPASMQFVTLADHKAKKIPPPELVAVLPIILQLLIMGEDEQRIPPPLLACPFVIVIPDNIEDWVSPV